MRSSPRPLTTSPSPSRPARTPGPESPGRCRGDVEGGGSRGGDVLLKMKEKQTGPAQAGAGSSSDGGLTGFLNLGHNNLFGSGQAVNIQLERGSRTRVVDLSYTDPWVHD